MISDLQWLCLRAFVNKKKFSVVKQKKKSYSVVIRDTASVISYFLFRQADITVTNTILSPQVLTFIVST
jgi:hypothetical protein